MTLRCTALLIAAILASTANGQTPEDAVRAFFAAIDARDQAELRRVVHEDSALRFGRELLNFAHAPLPDQEKTRVLQQLLGARGVPQTVGSRSPFDNYAALEFMYSPAKLEILGSVPEGAQKVHVVFRDANLKELPLISSQMANVITCIRVAESWRVQPRKGPMMKLETLNAYAHRSADQRGQ